MAELILEHSTQVKSSDGRIFIARTYGEERPDGTWVGWIEFTPVDGEGPTLVTDRETTQPNKLTLDYWASGLGRSISKARLSVLGPSVRSKEPRRMLDLRLGRQGELFERGL